MSSVLSRWPHWLWHKMNSINKTLHINHMSLKCIHHVDNSNFLSNLPYSYASSLCWEISHSKSRTKYWKIWCSESSLPQNSNSIKSVTIPRNNPLPRGREKSKDRKALTRDKPHVASDWLFTGPSAARVISPREHCSFSQGDWTGAPPP